MPQNHHNYSNPIIGLWRMADLSDSAHQSEFPTLFNLLRSSLPTTIGEFHFEFDPSASYLHGDRCLDAIVSFNGRRPSECDDWRDEYSDEENAELDEIWDDFSQWREFAVTCRSECNEKLLTIRFPWNSSDYSGSTAGESRIQMRFLRQFNEFFRKLIVVLAHDWLKCDLCFLTHDDCYFGPLCSVVTPELELVDFCSSSKLLFVSAFVLPNDKLAQHPSIQGRILKDSSRKGLTQLATGDDWVSHAYVTLDGEQYHESVFHYREEIERLLLGAGVPSRLP